MPDDPNSFTLVLGILKLRGKELQAAAVVGVGGVAVTKLRLETKDTEKGKTHMKFKKLDLYQKSVLSVMIRRLVYTGWLML
jgi:hypothetical protein